MVSACVVFNQVAGRGVTRERLEELLEPLRDAGWEIDVEASDARGAATSLAHAAVSRGCDVVIAAGGDGTVNEVLQALVGEQAALGVLPLGTGNVWAHQTGIPMDLKGAVDVLHEGWLRRVDVGQAGDRFFLLMAGIGYDAAVASITRPTEKRRLGVLAYIVKGIGVGLGLSGTRLTIKTAHGDRVFRALMVVVGNSRTYGGPISVRIAPMARMDDGLLDVVVFTGTGPLQAVWHVIMLVLGRHLRNAGVTYLQGTEYVVESEHTLLVQVDGDAIGSTPMRFRVQPAALSVVVPANPREDLFSKQAKPSRIGQALGA
ncbi:MAG: diacylglycerol kinase family lipid kinase [Dehalococcoidales bacterium]|nr:diacylglycerol kinase family lipid kinase [Dehalococcoidales bacterium]